MSKRRQGLKPRERDDWATPYRATVPLFKVLEPCTLFADPCCGRGELIEHVESDGHICTLASDLLQADARTARYAIDHRTVFVTNPPWRQRFEPNKIIENLSNQRALWALIPSDWLFNLRVAPLLPRLRKVVAVGRVKWVPNSPHSGFENSCWCLFDKPRPDAHATVRFVGRIPSRTPSTIKRKAA